MQHADDGRVVAAAGAGAGVVEPRDVAVLAAAPARERAVAGAAGHCDRPRQDPC